jgi:hypothetical protein
MTTAKQALRLSLLTVAGVLGVACPFAASATNVYILRHGVNVEYGVRGIDKATGRPLFIDCQTQSFEYIKRLSDAIPTSATTAECTALFHSSMWRQIISMVTIPMPVGKGADVHPGGAQRLTAHDIEIHNNSLNTVTKVEIVSANGSMVKSEIITIQPSYYEPIRLPDLKHGCVGTVRVTYVGNSEAVRSNVNFCKMEFVSVPLPKSGQN